MLPVTVPDLGEGVEKVQVVSWLVKEGDTVCKDDDIVELVTDKAVFNVPAPRHGILKQIKLPAGKEAPVGSILAFIE